MPHDTDRGPDAEGPLGHVRRALSHAEGAIRCYLALFAAEAQRRVASALRQAVGALILAGLALLGATLVVCGIALYVESRVGVPGAGLAAVGAALLAALAVVVLARRGGRPK